MGQCSNQLIHTSQGKPITLILSNQCSSPSFKVQLLSWRTGFWEPWQNYEIKVVHVLPSCLPCLLLSSRFQLPCLPPLPVKPRRGEMMTMISPPCCSIWKGLFLRRQNVSLMVRKACSTVQASVVGEMQGRWEGRKTCWELTKVLASRVLEWINSD